MPSHVAPPHVSWGSIELLHNVVRTLTQLKEDEGKPFPVVQYRAKVKLHGTNCAVQVTADGVYPQSRSTMLTPESDLMGFAAWVRDNRAYFAGLRPGLVVFGEWCGPGVQRGMAINAVKQRQFAVFAVRDGERQIVDPDEIRALVPAAGAPAVLHVLPWEGDTFTVDFAERASLDAAAAALSGRVEAVEREDPWVQRTFGVSGLGEGLVLYPVAVNGEPPPSAPEAIGALMFKAKGEKHRTVGARAAVQVDATTAASLDEFVDLVVTEPRLQQGVDTVCGGSFGTNKIGQFLAWVVADVRKESTAELAAAGLTWPQVEKPVQARARAWFLARRT
ncbi:MAG: hypothetical protein JNL82_03425 [Myxococcales bacterium]|nr:hypothetical protein [Myxococcales bacterium]